VEHEELFSEYRSLLFTVAYEILGSATDAEDVLQDSYLRWCRVELSSLTNPRAYLVQTVTRQALNQLRTAQRRREVYVGTWLPEPIRTVPDAGTDALLAESVSMAMLLVLETLGPSERAVFVLHEVFGFSHQEIAEMVGKTEATVRQIAHRARQHVQARRRRFEPRTDDAAEVVERFLRATRTGDITALMELMAPDVVHMSDGGGKVRAARRPVVGREEVARFVMGVSKKTAPGVRVEAVSYNALPALAISSADGLDYVLILELEGALIRGLYAVRNPEKLRASVAPRELSRGEDREWKP
jgi:RNA polymerase sigma-70 factor (ECF subfamily)